MAIPRRQRWTIQVCQAGEVITDPLAIDSASLTLGQLWPCVAASIPDRSTPWAATVYRVDPTKLASASLDERKRWGVVRAISGHSPNWALRHVVDRDGHLIASDVATI